MHININICVPIFKVVALNNHYIKHYVSPLKIKLLFIIQTRRHNEKEEGKLYFNNQLHVISIHSKNIRYSWLLREKSEEQICKQ